MIENVHHKSRDRRLYSDNRTIKYKLGSLLGHQTYNITVEPKLYQIRDTMIMMLQDEANKKGYIVETYKMLNMKACKKNMPSEIKLFVEV